MDENNDIEKRSLNLPLARTGTSLREKRINREINRLERRSLNLPLAEAGMSNAMKRLKRDNDMILGRTTKSLKVSLGIRLWFDSED